MIEFTISDLFFHHDFDGVVAASMVDACLSAKPTLHAVQYRQGMEWLKQDIGTESGIVDFLYHPSAKLWVDHHNTTFGGGEKSKNFVPDAYHVFDEGAPSCPDIIVRQPWFDGGKRWSQYLRWSNVIDSAAYESPSQANDLSNPYLLMSRVIAETDDANILTAMIRAIAHETAQDVLELPGIRPVKNNVLRNEEIIRKKLGSCVRSSGVVAILDQSSLPIPYRRYLGFEIYPNAIYGIGLYQSGKGVIVSVGENPWNRTGLIDLGALCTEYGGGGRKSTAGIPVETAAEALEIALELSKRLNELSK